MTFSIYSEGYNSRNTKFRIRFKVRAKFYKGGRSLQYVASLLNEKYSIITLYFIHFKKQIGAEVIGELTKYFVAKKRYPDEIELVKATKRFKRCLREKWFDHKVAGVPTQRSLKRKGSYRTSRKTPRPSFIDTGLFYKNLFIVLERY